MSSTRDIAELESLLDRILLGQDPRKDGRPVERAGELAGRSLSVSAQDELAWGASDEAAFQRSVVIAVAKVVLEEDRLAREQADASGSCVGNLALAAECRRLRQQLGRTQFEAAQWRERAVAVHVAEPEGAASSDHEGDDVPGSSRLAQEEREHIVALIGAFKRSWHWRIGHAAVVLAERILRRHAKPTALDAAEALARRGLQ